MVKPTLARIEERAERAWLANWLGWFILLCTCVLSGYWFVHTPVPGYAVAALGFVATVMSVREMPHTQKLLCTIAIFVLLIIELRAISHDRDESSKAQSEARAKENKEFKDVFDSFAKTAREFDSLHKRFDQSAQAGVQTGDIGNRTDRGHG